MSDGGMVTTRLRYVEVCAGAGGMGLGLHLAGWTGTGMELDADAVVTHNANVGPCEAGDLTTWHPPHRADLVAGGVPCQSFSQAGNRGGLGDPRGQLFRHLLRVAREADARVVLMENVQGLVHMGVLPLILTAFADSGFDPISAQFCTAFYGVPQKRKRLIILGFRDPSDRARFQWPDESHGRPNELFGLPRWRTVRDALALPAGDYAHGLLPHASAASPQGMRVLDVDAPAPTVGGHTADLLDEPSATVSAGSTDAGGAEPFANAGYRKRLAASFARLDQPSPTLNASKHKASANHGARGGTKDDRRVSTKLIPALMEAGLLERPATTVDATDRLSAAGHHTSNKSGAVRMSVAQLAALQSFPAGFTFTGKTSAQHKQVGNAVPPLFARALGEAIRRALYAGGAA